MNDTTALLVDGFRWSLVPGFSRAEFELLVGPGGVRLDGAAVVKEAPHRTVHHVRRDGLDVHVKHYRGDLREWWRCLARGRRAVREFRLTREVARRGVPTLEVLAVAERANPWGRSDSYLVTRTLPDVQPLLDYLEYELPLKPPNVLAALRQRLAAAVGELLAVKHRAGVRHDDLHPGNLLVRFVDGEPRLYLIDLDAVRLGAPLGWPASRANLVILDRWFALRWNRSDRRRAWRAYCRERTDLVLDERAMAGELFRVSHRSLLAHAIDLDRRCHGGNRHYRRLRSKHGDGYAVADLDAAALAALMADPTAALAASGDKLLKRSASSAVVEMTMPVAGQPRAVVLKHLPGSLTRSLLGLLRPPPALRSWLTGQALRLRSLPTPRPVAVWHRRRWGLWRDGYVLVEQVPRATHVRAFVESLASLSVSQRNARLYPVIDELARLLRQLHGWRLSHRDLKATNLLVSPADWVMSVRGLRDVAPSETSPRDRVWLIDLVGVRRHGVLGKGRRVRDLARLHRSFLGHPGLTRTDRLRFLRTYLAWGWAGKAGWKVWWRAIDDAARRQVAEHVRRGRVLG